MFSRGLAKRSGSLNPNEDLDAQSQRKLFILRNFRKGGGLKEKFHGESNTHAVLNPLAFENGLGGKFFPVTHCDRTQGAVGLNGVPGFA